MKKLIVVVAVLLFSSAVAGIVTIQFRGKSRPVDTLEKGSTLLLESGEFAWGLGVQSIVQGNKITFYLGRKAKITVDATLGKNDWLYVEPYAVAKALGYTVKLEKKDGKNPTDVLTVNYPSKIACADFATYEDANKFYRASSNLIGQSFEDRDPYNLDRGKDGSACDELPKAG